MRKRRADDVLRPHQFGRGVPDDAIRLQARPLHPGVRENEQLTTAVVFDVVVPCGLALAKHRDVMGDAIGDVGHDLGEMQRRVGVVIHAQQEDLAVVIEDPAERAPVLVGRQHQRIGNDLRRLRSTGGKGERVTASANVGNLPERVGDDPQVGGRRCRRRVKRPVIIAGP